MVGRPNTGKTLFVLNFAAYLGLATVAVDVVDSDGRVSRRQWPVARARRQWVSPLPHRTLHLQRIRLPVAAGKVRRELVLIDSPGVLDGIPAAEAVRHAMALTLETVTHSSLILHLVDASRAEAAVGPFDRELAAYAPLVGAYAVLANKMDLPAAQAGLARVRRLLPAPVLIPLSARTGRGFREVKAFVFRHWA